MFRLGPSKSPEQAQNNEVRTRLRGAYPRAIARHAASMNLPFLFEDRSLNASLTNDSFQVKCQFRISIWLQFFYALTADIA